ncbi:alternative oxidase [Altererythrobacter lutimaris]|uniref:Alternative oxidase n=1 Tax=Altererythrobacter lutimaris TaxID=2743979 RepID=A0A850H992_9SPHN|nr:alternative oxidase [Altererythrobacter lutimaris]NVE93511.1 alternative oxidase [Altererythrobacter lutimaris]
MKHLDTKPLVRQVNPDIALTTHVAPVTLSDKIAFSFVKFLRFFADTFFAKRYGHRAVVLETVAGVPGMVGGLWQHLTALRKMRDDEGWIRTLLDEAENERMHLMTFIEIAQPNRFERFLIMVTQLIFYNFYFWLYLFAPRTAHRVVGYFEEEAVISYTAYLAEVDAGRHENVPAPQIAIDYWQLSADARLRDVIIAVRADEAEHRDVNHAFVDELDRKDAHRPGSPIRKAD